MQQLTPKLAASVLFLCLSGLSESASSVSSQVEGISPEGADRVVLGVGTLLTAHDLPLYISRRDVPNSGASVCDSRTCGSAWQPFLKQDADVSRAVGGRWSVIARKSGDFQWAYDGLPVYTNKYDRPASNSLVGEKDPIWDVLIEPLRLPPSIAILGTEAGQVLVYGDNQPLYWHENDDACDGDCPAGYVPFEAAWLAKPPGEDWSVLDTASGLKQWAYKNKRLYTRGTGGSGADSDEVPEKGWVLAVVEPPSPVPDWVTYQESDLGVILADARGQTLYMLNPDDMARVEKYTCDAACIRSNLGTVPAVNAAESIGNWSVKSFEGDGAIWHYLGAPVFTYKNDSQPGHIYGDRFAAGGLLGARAGWHAITKESLIQVLVTP